MAETCDGGPDPEDAAVLGPRSSLLQTKAHLGDHRQTMDPKPDGGADDCASDVGEVHEFTVDGVTRCFNLFTPASATKPMPVVIYFHGKGGAANKICSSKTEVTQAAESMGFALLCGDAYENWQFPRVGGDEGVSSANPQPCTSEDTPEVDYVQTIFDTLAAASATYDNQKIYTQGFSQGAMMTTWATTCFASKIRGASQAGSGLKLAKDAVTKEWCAGSSSRRCSVKETDGNNIPGGSCPESSACEYFPIKTTKQQNSVGRDLKWCLFAGCSDYLLGSVLSQNQHLTDEGAPVDIFYYDMPHKAPENWMPKVAQCHGWDNAPEVNEEPWLDSCEGIDLGTNDGKYCLGETGCGGTGGGGSGGGGGGGPPGKEPDCKPNCENIPKEWSFKCSKIPFCMTCEECEQLGD